MDDKLPPPIKITPNSPDIPNPPNDDDPIFEAKINNPFSKFFSWIKDFLKKQSNITIKIPIIGIIMGLSGLGIGWGTGYNWGFNTALAKLFPNSSPVFHRAVSLEGVIQKSASAQFYLKSEDNLWILKPKSPITPAIIETSVEKQVKVLGNLTKEANAVEVSEIIPLESPQPTLTPLTSLVNSYSSTSSNPSNPPDSELKLPDLFTGLQWVSTQKKVLVFTSGKRRMDVEGFHIESSQLTSFPQDFINYYITELKNKGFKETLNSINPEGITVTYSKDDLFLTFGVKNIYQGKADKKQLAGYVAYLEHN
ncbi:hypothetical protein HYW42_01590 [Candidatus Daviesbacteria bacterium]|nr:hypothetical protein [Candidatus Daviesbacteria bacterium]